ncbi:hypothetical protein N0V93_005734 [Gnomoniopsis smithogilvyi]|uniref:Helicase ATP-binding domain-containing protein n=1 Tax=Gnomoniopsis smithogilvyi TaxID=1191159 RepID=A0A9W8YX62_9PEZI|nr:hypothetical protein N0V93_005734 [Gnomoniopsis smithogilvyi]
MLMSMRRKRAKVDTTDAKPMNTAGDTGTFERRASCKAADECSVQEPNSADESEDEDPESVAKNITIQGPDLTLKPLSDLRAIIQDLLDSAKRGGLHHFVDSNKQFYTRVGTLCSGTDAPLHVLNLFGMLKNANGDQVFTTINKFACEIEPFKQGFLLRNSKPEQLFRDATDFAKPGAKQAYLVSGVESDIPDVDLFIAGTSCVDFSSLNSRKTKEFERLAKANNKWKDLYSSIRVNGGALTLDDLRDEDWRLCIDSMLSKTGTNRTSTTTFASAMNYLKERQPKIVIFENVHGAPWASTIDYVFPLTGYAAKIVALDTKNYYLPQTRLRKYVVAFNHRFFGLQAAQTLCDDFTAAVQNLERKYSSTVTDFLLPSNSHELHRARNEMELASQSTQEKDTDWSFSRSRHTQFRRAQGIPDERPWIQWRENGTSNAPAKMWKPWEAPLPNRVKDLLECFYQLGMAGKNLKHGKYDAAFKAQILDCSQNVDRVNMGQPFGGTGCLTPCAIPVLTLEARPITGSEALKLQGLPIENFDMSIETQSQLQNLAGNAMSTTVVGAAILSTLSCVAIYDAEHKKGWLKEKLFLKGDFEDANLKDYNSFHGPDAKFNIKEFCELDGLVLSAYTNSNVAQILLLGEKTRRRCVCQHILAYSSMALYTCEVCGASLCKSCKGNPEHRMSKSSASFNDIGSLTYANAEDALRQHFPPVLPMLSVNQNIAGRIAEALQSSHYTSHQRMILADALTAGLSDTIYELAFIEITDATRIEYVSKDNFILRSIIEKDQLVWYLYLDQWSNAAQNLGENHKTNQPIARAVIRANSPNQFPAPDAWDLWVPRNAKFDLRFRLGHERELQLVSVGDVTRIDDAATQCEINSLAGTKWTYHPECGFPERALWVCSDSVNKLYMFLDVNPIGASSHDRFVISSVNREMGRAPQPESRPVLLHVRASQRVHTIIETLEKDEELYAMDDSHELASTNKGDKYITLKASVDGWWTSLVNYSVRFPAFRNELTLFAERGFPSKPPASLLLKSNGANISLHGHAASCHRDQVLLTMSLPVFGKSSSSINNMVQTIRDLDLAQQLDFAEFCRIISPCYTAVERAIIEHFQGTRTIQLWDAILTEDCTACAPKLPTVVWRKPAVKGQGSVVATCEAADEQTYNASLLNQPSSFRIDHSVTLGISNGKKIAGVQYIDIRFVGRAHTLMQQARSRLSTHPGYHRDTSETRATFALGVGILENPRIALQNPKIRAPPSISKLQESELQPEGFKKGMALLPEQLASLQWMINRENDEDQMSFVEKELAEVYIDRLRFRAIAKATRQIVRRGRVVADDVGFGKTAVCLGLMDRQRQKDGESRAQRATDQSLVGLKHLKATLIIVPNHLTQQWKTEAHRFLNDANYNICVIETYPALAKATMLKEADIIICSNQVFKHKDYKAELSKHCSTDGLDVTISPKVYRSWYKKAHRNLITAQTSLLTDSVQAFEYFTFARVIWDEFPYENIEVTEFVANCITSSKWMLSGTPPLITLGQVCKIAYLFNVHLARPLSLVAGRQPKICENAPLMPLSPLEEAELYKSRPSPEFLRERHGQLLNFVQNFFSKNKRESNVESSHLPVVLSLSTNSRSAYLELQQDLSWRNFNANLVSADARRRLMSRVDWKEKSLGVNRAMEALALRASISFDDVKNQILFTDAQHAKSTVDVARAMYENSNQTIKDLEDRGRELLGKAYYLAYRCSYIYVKTHGKTADNGEARQCSYFETIEKFVRNILAVDFEETFWGWDAFESAIRILIWDEKFEKQLESPDGPATSSMSTPSRTDKDAWRAKLKDVWDDMRFGVIAADAPPPESAHCRPASLEKKMKSLKTFKELITKSPLHSRRWFRINDMPAPELTSVLPLLKMEWEHKVPWEASFRKSNPGIDSFLIPVRELRQPVNDELAPFDLDKISREDSVREKDLDEMPKEVEDRVEQQVRARTGKSRITKADWVEECVRRGLKVKSAETGHVLKRRVCQAEIGKASEEHWVTPEGCPLKVIAIPVEGKVRIRGGNMEALFDELMHTVDDFTVLIERLASVHGKKNYQKVIWQVLAGQWRCDTHSGHDALSTHYVSLKCGHVHCSLPRGTCGVRGCTASLTDVCIPLAKFNKEPRVISSNDFAKGALCKEPAAYLSQDGEGKGPKINAIVELIKSMAKDDQVVIFVQNTELLGDMYEALRVAGVSHVTAAELKVNEATALEKFKSSDMASNKKQVLVQLINSEQAAGSNLHNANHVIFLSPLVTRDQGEWDAQMKQALGRCIRFRQQKTVHVYHMLMDETIEVDTLEWRYKKEIFVRPGCAVGTFNVGEPTDFLERFDSQDATAAQPGFQRAISLLPRGEIQWLMGDDYVSVTMARSKETVESTNAAAMADEEVVDFDVIMKEA